VKPLAVMQLRLQKEISADFVTKFRDEKEWKKLTENLTWDNIGQEYGGQVNELIQKNISKEELEKWEK
jgi:hypothetical protein